MNWRKCLVNSRSSGWTAHLQEYMRLAQTEEGFRRYLDLYVFQRRAA